MTGREHCEYCGEEHGPLYRCPAQEENERHEAPAPQPVSPSKSSDLLKCPVCERYKCREYQEPIDYTVCSSCLSVIVLGKDGTVSLLSHARAL